MIDGLIGLIGKISGDLVFDVGLIIVLASLLIAVIVFELIAGLSYSGKLKKLSMQMEGKLVKTRKDFDKLAELIEDAGINAATDSWFSNITVNPTNDLGIAWRRDNHLLMAQSTVANTRFRTQARLIPGLIVLLSIIVSAFASFVQVAGSMNSDDTSVLQGSWQKTVLILIVGIISAGVFMMIDALFCSLVIKKIKQLFDVTSNILPVFSEDDWLVLQLQEVQKTNEKIASLENRLVESLVKAGEEQLLPGLMRSYKDSLDKYLVPEIAALRKSAENYSSKILQVQQSGMTELADSFYQNMSANLDAQLERQSSLIEKLEHMQQVGAERLEHIISRSDDNLLMQRELNSQALLTIEGISSSKIALTEAAEKLTDGMGRAGELAAAMQELLEADRNLLGELSSERVAMQSINNGYFEKMNNQVLQLQDDLNSEITNLLSRFTDIYSVTFENIEEQTGSLIESFDSQTRSLIDSLDEQVRDLTFLTKDVTAEIADLNKNLKDSTSEFASNFNSSLNGHLSSLDSSVNELMTKLASTTELIRESVDDLPAAVLLARMSIDKASDSDSVEDSD